MPNGPLDLTEITAARDALAQARVDAVARGAERARFEREMRLARSSSEQSVYDQLRRRRDDASRAEFDAFDTMDEARAAIARFSAALLEQVPHERAVEQLDGGLPVALLPVRIETRFADNGTTLHIRVFPDQIHVDAHEPELTDDEIEAGRHYWTERGMPDGTDTPEESAAAASAWRLLTGRIRPERAAWIVERMRPLGLAADGGLVFDDEVPRRAASWSRAKRAVALPDRWVAIGRRDGEELFRVWSSFVPDELAVSPSPGADADRRVAPDGTTLPLDEPMAWITDPAAAAANGMMVTVTDADVIGGGHLAGGVEQLFVLGVDWTVGPDVAAASLDELLRSHMHTSGLGFVASGTPTNNTGRSRSGMSAATGARVDALDPAVAPTDHDDEWAASRRLERALGIPRSSTVLDRVPGAAGREQAIASALTDATWYSTWGYYLDDLFEPYLDVERIDQLRRFVGASLFAGGPLPTLRVGAQPYGVLPVVAPGRYRAARPLADGAPVDDDARLAAEAAGLAAGGAATVAGMLPRLRPIWEEGVGRVERLGRTRDLDATMLALLQQSPVASTARFRRVFGPTYQSNTSGFADMARQQAFVDQIAAWRVMGHHVGDLPRVAEFTTDAVDYPLPVPWAIPIDHTPSAPLPYVGEIDTLVVGDGRADLMSRSDATTILEAMLAFSAAKELEGVEVALVRNAAASADIDFAHRATLRTPEFLRVTDTDAGSPRPSSGAGQFEFTTSYELSHAVIPQISTDKTVAQVVAEQIAAYSVDNYHLYRLRDFHGVGLLRDGLRVLSEAPAETVDWLFRAQLGTSWHRLDAWYTALATHNLAEVRRRRDGDGVHLGCYGYVEGLTVDTAPDSQGYVHTPSLAHAATAAVLRSGHLSHRGDDRAILDIDLSARRVREALTVIEGVAEGQSLAALLGYRFERSLRERDIELARYILPIRLLAPMRHLEQDLEEPREAIAARDVVDGVELLERWRDDNDALLDEAEVADADRAAVADLLRRTLSLYDAVSDVLMSESVFQTVQGNFERAGAALAMLDRQQRPLDPEFVRTPRGGSTVTHRVVVVLPDDPPDDWPVDTRATFDPRLNSWAGRLLGPPTGIGFTATLTDGETSRIVTVGPDELGLSPLSLLLAAHAAAGVQATELEERIALQIVSSADGLTSETTLTIEHDPPAAVPDALGLGAIRLLADWFVSTTSGRAALQPADLCAPSGDVDAAGVDVAALTARVDALLAARTTAIAGLGDALDEASAADTVMNAEIEAARVAGTPLAPATVDAHVTTLAVHVTALVAALHTVGHLGVVDALPVAPPIPSADVDPDAPEVAARLLRARLADLAARAVEIGKRLDAATTASNEADAAYTAIVDPPIALTVEHLVAQARSVLGSGFPVLPEFRAANPVELDRSVVDDALVGPDRTAPTAWLHRMALVRPDLDALSSLLATGEAFGRDLGGPSVAVAQVPHRPGQGWVAITAEPASAHGTVGIVMHAPDGFDPFGLVAGVVVDSWSETIPASTDTTGVGFHYDAPAARPPQTILLAVPPDVDQPNWTFDALFDTVREAVALARLRVVGPKEIDALGGYLPATYLPQNFTADVPTVNFFDLLAAHPFPLLVLGKA